MGGLFGAHRGVWLRAATLGPTWSHRLRPVRQLGQDDRMTGRTQEGAAPAVCVEHLTVVRGRTRAVDDVSFELGTGTLVGLLGPSGCGKTTLMRSLVGTQVVSSGTVSLLGEPAGSPGTTRPVGYVTQVPSVYEDLTVRENLSYFLSSVHRPRPSSTCWPMSTSTPMPGRSWGGYRVANTRVCRSQLRSWVRPAFSYSTNRRSASTRCCAGACGRYSAGWHPLGRPCSFPATSWTKLSAVSGCFSSAMVGFWPTPVPRGAPVEHGHRGLRVGLRSADRGRRPWNGRAHP